MPPRMMTQSAGRVTAAPQGGRTGGRTGRGGGRTRGRSGDQGNDGIDGQGGQVGGQGTEGDVRNATVNNDQRGCTYKEFLACNPKEYDGKGGAIVYTRWIEKMKLVQDISGCKDNQKAGHAVYTDKFHELARLVPHLVTPENKRIERRGRAFMLGSEEARQDPNIVTGTFTLNDPYATTLFDSSADYSFVSTTFIPLLGIEPSDLGSSYEIEIASGQLVEIDTVIRGCKLEIDGHVFDINLISFGRGSFDVIIGMDWLSNHKAKIICHEKVVRIPLLDDKYLEL
ncbi:putative reverse transcriptase domain-containing protein [Tanacetum coccineum]